MSIYSPPSDILKTFNTSVFTADDDFLTLSDADSRYCKNINGFINNSLTVNGPIHAKSLLIKDSSVTIGNTVDIRLGINDTTYNYSDIKFNYLSDASNTNYLNIGGLNSYTGQNLVSINTLNPSKSLDINSSTGDNFRLIYNDTTGSPTYYTDFLMTSSGDLTINNQRYTNILNHNGSTLGLQLGSVLVTSTALELNILDGCTATASELNYTNITSIGTAQASKALVLNASSNITSGINEFNTTTLKTTNLYKNGTIISATATELDYTKVTTLGTAQGSKALVLNSSAKLLSGLVELHSQYLLCDSLYINSTLITSSGAELNLLDGLTSSTTELNLLDGCSCTTAELNYLDITTIGVAQASKALVFDSSRNISNINNITTTGSLGVNTTTLSSSQVEINSLTGDCLRLKASETYWSDFCQTIYGLKIETSEDHIELYNSHLLLHSNHSHDLISTTEAYHYDISLHRDLSDVGLRIGISFNIGTESLLTAIPDSTIICEAVSANTNSLIFSTRLVVGSCDERFRIDSTGFMGINTTAPDRMLDVNHSSGNCLRLSYNAPSGSATYFTDLLTNGAGDLTITNQRYTNISNHNGSTLGLQLGGVLLTATAAELNSIAGLSGLTATVAELNILDGCTCTFSELNLLDGVTSSTSELNILNGVTSNATELNYVDVTTIGTAQSSKALIVDSSSEIDNIYNLSSRALNLKASTGGFYRFMWEDSSTISDYANQLYYQAPTSSTMITSIFSGAMLSISGGEAALIVGYYKTSGVQSTNMQILVSGTTDLKARVWVNGIQILGTRTTYKNMGETWNLFTLNAANFPINSYVPIAYQFYHASSSGSNTASVYCYINHESSTSSMYYDNDALTPISALNHYGLFKRLETLNYPTEGTALALCPMIVDEDIRLKGIHGLQIYGQSDGTLDEHGLRFDVKAGHVINDNVTPASATNTNLVACTSIGRSHVGALNTNVITTTCCSFYIESAPYNYTNNTITNPYALYIGSGLNFMGGGLNIQSGGLSLAGTLVDSTALELNYTNITSIGTAQASKALVLNASSNITSGINEFNTTTLKTTNLYKNGTIINATSAELDYTKVTTLGTAQGSKALVLNSSAKLLSGLVEFHSQYLLCDSLYINSTLITSTGAELNLLDGVTASTAELNLLDGCTCSTTELNYVDVTTIGTAQASKALVLNSSKTVMGLTTIEADHIWSGISSGSVPLYINGAASITLSGYAYFNSSASTGTIGMSTNNYSAYFSGRIVCSGEIDVTSDYRIKKNIVDLDLNYCRNFIEKANPIKYQLKTEDDEETPHLGYIAQDVIKAGFDELVDVAPEEGLEEIIEPDGFINPANAKFAISYMAIIPILHKNIKELYRENDWLKQRNFKMYDEINDLKSQIKKIHEIIEILAG